MTVVKRLLRVVRRHDESRLQCWLYTLIVVSLSLMSFACISLQLLNGIIIPSGVRYLSSDSVAVRHADDAVQENRTSKSASLYQRRLFVQLPCASARLGNRMFAHAALLGLASHIGLQAGVLTAYDNNILRSTFDLKTPAVTDDGRIARLRTVEWPWRTAVYVPPPSNLTDDAAADDDILLIGYFQSWRYFHAVEERVRAEFQFRKHISDMAADVLRPLTDKYSRTSTDLVLVGIHVRRSDMAASYHLQRGYTVADEHYIRRAMNYVADRVTADPNANSPSLVFVVCTDDEEWTRLNVRSSSHPVVFASSPDRRAAVDLAVLSSCDHVIITVGTFSWWAGYLHRPDGITVYFAGFPKPGTEIGNNFHAHDVFPPGWIGLL